MSLLSYFLPLLFLLLNFPSFSISATCPLNITILRHIGDGTLRPIDSGKQCHYITQAINLVQSDYLHRTGFFVPPLNTAESCWKSFQSFIDEFQPNFDIRRSCGFQTSWISQGCMNITTKSQFENQVSLPQLQSLQLNCNVSLDNNAPCALCTSKRSEALSSLTGATPGTIADCRSYTAIYSASLSVEFGPTNTGTAKCLFGLDFTSDSSGSNNGMPEPGTPEILEKYVLVAVLCSHPQLYARPTMDQVVKMLETDDEAVPSVERPIPFIAGRLDIEKSASNNSGQLCSPTGYQAYTMQLQSRRTSTCNEEEGNSKRPSNCKEDEGNSKSPSNCKEKEGNSECGSVSKD
ncbi:hypothetical protein TSUD_333350 [Trifolium subterraneum]|uniref:SPARK domain-containing protein n=1 Tax=Trifolium subterraneum TaxID=3900 RepID=A0A2Z6NIN9_TRISU|nr:hypothetical protein TSUD_333350 [Trifolium subterraneum]